MFLNNLLGLFGMRVIPSIGMMQNIILYPNDKLYDNVLEYNIESLLLIFIQIQNTG